MAYLLMRPRWARKGNEMRIDYQETRNDDDMVGEIYADDCPVLSVYRDSPIPAEEILALVKAKYEEQPK